jgi:exo-1,4-beta-D-glucosaminidase
MDKKTILFIALVFASLWPVCSYAQKVANLSQKVALKEGWFVQNSSKINISGAGLSSGLTDKGDWLNASVPSTVMGVLTKNGLYKDIFVGDNYKDIDKLQFDHSWWYVKPFETPTVKENQHITLHFEGINYYANIWLNGKLLSSRDSVFGTFRRFEFDITKLVSPNGNVLAVEIFRAQPGDFNLGFVDWNPRPVDENMGIWREVYLKIAGNIELANSYVESKVNTITLAEADLTIKTNLRNNSTKLIDGFLKGRIDKIEFRYPVTISAGETVNLTLTKDQIPALHFKKPRLWWCNNLGSPELYQLDLSFETGNTITDADTIIFGIREIECYTNPLGHKGYKLNGKEVLIKGAGWTDDIFLRDSLESIETQVQYVKHMNLNAIRFESIWGNTQDIYSLCDKYGILAMVGWSCQWEWDEYLGKTCNEFGGILTEQDMSLAINSFRDQILWLRNHPSIFVWMIGSDKCPKPELELRYIQLFKSLDNRPYLATAGTRVSSVSGPCGVKMNGPYEYVAPNYWYIDTINGGAFGFNTETGPGPQVPVPESLKKMLPPDKLWPINEDWNYHCTHSKHALNSMNVFNEALNERFGKPANLESYLLKSDAQSYEALKAMFEAFRANIPKTTGIIHWMLNSAWPSLYWQLYDYYLTPTPAFYAARKANQPVQLVYNYGDNAIYAINETLKDVSGYKSTVKLLNAESKELLNREVVFSIAANTSKKIMELGTLKETVFLDLKISDAAGKNVGDNFYWLSAKKDEFAWDKTTWVYTPLKGFADFSALNSLPASDVAFTYKITDKGNETLLTVSLKNHTQKIAFFLTLMIDDAQGKTISTVLWDDNYFSLLPGENRVITCTIPKNALNGIKPGIKLSGWNIKTQVLEVK